MYPPSKKSEWINQNMQMPIPYTPLQVNKHHVDGWTGVIIVLYLVWALLGFAAFVMSIVCFNYAGTPAENGVGLLLALLTGPFYFIYYMMGKTYCKTNNNSSFF